MSQAIYLCSNCCPNFHKHASPTGRQAKICDGPKRANGVKNMMFASKIDVQAAEEYDGNNSDN